MKKDIKNIKKKYNLLIQQIKKHNHYYYTLDRPIVSDRAYDKLYKQLQQLEKQHPQIVSKQSPSTTVGSSLLKGFEKQHHSTPMLSLENSYDSEEIVGFIQKILKRVEKLDKEKSLKDLCFSFEPKLDGVSLELVYEKGELTKAITRGDGKVGENVLFNATTISEIPLKITTPLDLLEIRGEIIILKKDFQAINEALKEKKQTLFVNPRNAAAGTLRQLDSKVAQSRPLKSFFYSIAKQSPEKITSQKETLSFFKKEKIPTIDSSLTLFCSGEKGHLLLTNKHISFLKDELKKKNGKEEILSVLTDFILNKLLKKHKLQPELVNLVQKEIQKIKLTQLKEDPKLVLNLVIKNIEFFLIKDLISSKAVDYYRKIEQKRASLPFEIDGIVIKVDSLDLQKKLGDNGNTWNWAFSGKFEAQTAITQIENIKIQIGRTGVLSPVAIMKPIHVAGVSVRRASLYNQTEIKKLNIQKGDKVLLKRAGDVIPKIISLAKKKDVTDYFKFPKKCPACKTNCITETNTVVAKGASRCIEIISCPNEDCPDVQLARLKHFASKSAMNMDTIGEKNIEQFFKKKIVKNFSDFYKIKKEHITSLEKQGEKSADNILKSIHSSKNTDLKTLLYSLGIPHLGEKSAEYLANHFKSLSQIVKICKTKNKEAFEKELQFVEKIGTEGKNKKRIADSVFHYIKKWSKEIESLQKLGVQVENMTKKTGIFSNKKIVVTGSFDNLSRTEVKKIVENLGGKIQSQVTKNTNLLIKGDAPGKKKAEQATTWETPTLNKLDFFKNNDIKRLSKKK